MPRSFSREEADDLLPEIAPLLWELRRQYGRMKSATEKAAALRERSKGNGHALAEELAAAEQDRVTAATAVEQLAERITGIGIELKDPEQGLVDIHSEIGGRHVYLCWKLGEERIEWWHDLDTGFAGRQRLD
jgi:hypothetical protein